MKNKWVGWVILGALFVVLAYVASPYWAAYRFKEAAMGGNVDRLEATTDFPAVRESLKSQLSTAMMANLQNDPTMKDNPFSGLGMMMMPAIVDKMVDVYVTPTSIALLAQGEKPAPTSEPKSDTDKIGFSYGYEYVTMDRFRVQVKNDTGGKPAVGLVFDRRGWFSWKLIRVEIPQEILKMPSGTTSAE